MSLWFVTPAWRRYELTRVCLEQRQRVIAHLRRNLIDARCVVIADDENLDIARSFGFDTVEQNNDGLGRKWNDGIKYAANHGAEWIVPIGSDSWIDPWYFIPLPDPSVARTSGLYCAVTHEKVGVCNVTNPRLSAGPYVFHRSLLEPSGFRPTDDNNSTNTDHSMLAGIGRTRIRWEHRDLHSLQYVGFRGEPHMTSYASLMRHWGIDELRPEVLKNRYPSSLVDRAIAAITPEEA